VFIRLAHSTNFTAVFLDELQKNRWYYSDWPKVNNQKKFKKI